MRRIPVEVPAHGAKPYDVIISGGLLDEAGKIAKNVVKPCKALIFTDNNVVSLYADRVEKSLADEGFKVFRFVYESGLNALWKSLIRLSRIIVAKALLQCAWI